MRDVPLVEAAEAVGYDCSTWENVKRLIDAVHEPKRTYPDKWSGPAAYRSSIYPDRWTPAQGFVHKDVSQPSRHPNWASCMPPSIIPINQNPADLGIPSSFDNNAKALPTRPKRHSDDFVDLTNDSTKKRKTNLPNSSNILIDLTEDSDDDDSNNAMAVGADNPDPSLPISTTTYGILQDISNASQVSARPTNLRAPDPEHAYELQQCYRAHHVSQQRIKQARKEQTETLFGQIASRLRATTTVTNGDREILRERWDDDDDIKDPSLNTTLVELNECFTRIGEAATDAVDIIQHRLLPRP